jgi:hypothetical protein
MDVEDIIILFLSFWILLSAILVRGVDVFLTLVLIGLLITLEVSGVFLERGKKEQIKPIVYLLLFVFSIIVMKKIYEVLVK